MFYDFTKKIHFSDLFKSDDAPIAYRNGEGDYEVDMSKTEWADISHTAATRFLLAYPNGDTSTDTYKEISQKIAGATFEGIITYDTDGDTVEVPFTPDEWGKHLMLTTAAVFDTVRILKK